jgi:hypothetical protein
LNGSGLGFLVFLLEKVIITGEQFRWPYSAHIHPNHDTCHPEPHSRLSEKCFHLSEPFVFVILRLNAWVPLVA